MKEFWFRTKFLCVDLYLVQEQFTELLKNKLRFGTKSLGVDLF